MSYTVNRTLVHTPMGRVTHTIAELQGTSVLTGCGLTLAQGYSEIKELGATPTCKSCARKC